MHYHIKENVETIKAQGIGVGELCEMFACKKDQGGVECPEEHVAQLCLDWAGKTIVEYKELYTAAVYAACGIRTPKLGEDGQIIERTHERKLLNEDNVKVVEEYRKIQCDSTKARPKKDKRCGKTFWAEGELEGITKCKKHRAMFDEASQD